MPGQGIEVWGLGFWESGRTGEGWQAVAWADRQTLRCLVLMGMGVGTSVLEYRPPVASVMEPTLIKKQ
jgi:hypothetical protein